MRESSICCKIDSSHNLMWCNVKYVNFEKYEIILYLYMQNVKK